MRERLLARDAVQVGAAAEGTAAGGQHESLDDARRLVRHELMQGGMLGVDRDQLRARRLGECGHELAADHEALLVGEREVDALPQRGDRRAEAGRAHERVQDEVAVGVGDQRDEALGAAEHLAVGPGLRGLGGGVLVGQRDALDAEPLGLRE